MTFRNRKPIFLSKSVGFFMRATDRVRVARRRGVIGRNGHCAVQQVDEATSRAIRHRRTCRRHVV